MFRGSRLKTCNSANPIAQPLNPEPKNYKYVHLAQWLYDQNKGIKNERHL
jgi:hypothetical protein